VNFDQSALVDLFRQSFSPLTQLGAGRLAMTQAALERDYAAREQAARRAQALQDHMEGLRMQAQYQQQLQEAAGAQAMARQTAGNEANLNRQLIIGQQNAGMNMLANETAANRAIEAKRFDEAQRMAANLGLEVDPEDPDFVTKVTKEAAKVNAKHRQSATEIYRELSGLTDQMNRLSTEVEVPADRLVQIARPLLVAAATDPKKQAAYKKLGSLDAILEAAAEEGAADKITGAIQKEQALRNQTFEKKARPLQARQQQLQRTMTVLEQRGISPDYEALRASVAPVDAAEPEADAGPQLPNATSVLPPLRGEGSAAGAEALGMPAGTGFGLAGSVAQIPRAVGALADNIGQGAGWLGERMARVAVGTRGVEALNRGEASLNHWLSQPVRFPQGDVDVYGGVRRFALGQDDTSSFAVGEEANRQRSLLATLDGLIRSAQDPAVAGQLRAARRGSGC